MRGGRNRRFDCRFFSVYAFIDKKNSTDDCQAIDRQIQNLQILLFQQKRLAKSQTQTNCLDKVKNA